MSVAMLPLNLECTLAKEGQTPFAFTFELTVMDEVELEAMLILDYTGHRRS